MGRGWSRKPVTLWCTHTRLMAVCPGLPGWAGARKVKPIWTLLKQETVSGSGIHWDICKSAPCSRQITMPAPHCSVFYRPDAFPTTQPTASKHLRWYDVGYCKPGAKPAVGDCLVDCVKANSNTAAAVEDNSSAQLQAATSTSTTTAVSHPAQQQQLHADRRCV